MWTWPFCTVCTGFGVSGTFVAQFTTYPCFPMISGTRNRFSPITGGVSALGHVLLRRSCMDVPVAVLLHSIRGLCHVPVRSWRGGLGATPKVVFGGFLEKVGILGHMLINGFYMGVHVRLRLGLFWGLCDLRRRGVGCVVGSMWAWPSWVFPAVRGMSPLGSRFFVPLGGSVRGFVSVWKFAGTKP